MQAGYVFSPFFKCLFAWTASILLPPRTLCQYTTLKPISCGLLRQQNQTIANKNEIPCFVHRNLTSTPDHVAFHFCPVVFPITSPFFNFCCPYWKSRIKKRKMDQQPNPFWLLALRATSRKMPAIFAPLLSLDQNELKLPLQINFPSRVTSTTRLLT